jgi:hypothetical protein
MEESEKEYTEVKEEEACGNKPTWRRRYRQLRETSAAYVIFEPRGREKKKTTKWNNSEQGRSFRVLPNVNGRP